MDEKAFTTWLTKRYSKSKCKRVDKFCEIFLISRFSEGSDMVDLNPETGAITWTRDLTNVTEYMDIQLIVLPEDHGTPRLNATGLYSV